MHTGTRGPGASTERDRGPQGQGRRGARVGGRRSRAVSRDVLVHLLRVLEGLSAVGADRPREVGEGRGQVVGEPLVRAGEEVLAGGRSGWPRPQRRPHFWAPVNSAQRGDRQGSCYRVGACCRASDRAKGDRKRWAWARKAEAGPRRAAKRHCCRQGSRSGARRAVPGVAAGFAAALPILLKKAWVFFGRVFTWTMHGP